MRFESQLSLMYCQMFSTGFSSGHRAGSEMMLTLEGRTSFFVVCQPAWSMMRTACAPGATARDISAKCRFIAEVSQKGRTSPAALPCWGHIAPKM